MILLLIAHKRNQKEKKKKKCKKEKQKYRVQGISSCASIRCRQSCVSLLFRGLRFRGISSEVKGGKKKYRNIIVRTVLNFGFMPSR